MTPALLRVALAASWCGRRGERRRAAMLAVAAALVTVVVCGCAGAWLLSSRIDARATARAFVPPGPGEPVAFERAALFDETADGDQIYVYWWRVVDGSALIPGVGADPPVGSWLVSPALAERMDRQPSLAARYPGAGVIGADGVAHRGELLAYRFVGAGTELTEQLANRPGADWIGDGGEVVDPYPIAVAAVALVGIPGLGLLVAAAGPLGARLDRRLTVLDALGAPPRAQLLVVVAQAALCAGPGAVAGAVGWFVVAGHLTAVPLVGRSVFPSDLATPLPVVLAAGLAVTVMSAVVAAVRPRRLPGNRPAEAVPTAPAATRALPLAAGLCVMVAGALVAGRSGAKVFLVGVVATAVGTVVGLPYVIDRAGSALARRPGTTWLLVGRRLRWNAVASTRSLLAVGVLAVLAPLVAAWVAVARDVDAPRSGDAYAVELRGELADGDRDDLVRRTGAEPVDVVALSPDAGAGGLALVGDCAALSAHLRMARCGAGGFAISSSPGTDLGGYGGLPGVAQPPAGAERLSTLFVSSDGRAVEDLLRRYVVNGSAPRTQVTTPGRAVFHESPLVAWILGAARLAGLVGGLALVLHLAGQAARLAPSRARLLALGADIAVVRRLAGAEAALAVGLVGAGCAVVGWLTSWMFVQRDGTAAVPYGAIGLVLAATVAAATLAGLAAAAAVPGEVRPASDVS